MIGPPGVRARPHPWWTPVRLLLAVAVVTYAVCVLVKTPCADGGKNAGWWNSPADYANLCASDLPLAYTTTGLAEGVPPLSTSDGRFAVPDESPPTAVLAYGAAALTRALHGWPDTDTRAAHSTDVAAQLPQVRDEAVTYVAVSAVAQLVALLVAVGCLAGLARVPGPRGSPVVAAAPGVTGTGASPWLRRLLPFVASPLLVFAGLTGWDLVPVALACAGWWAWSRGRDTVAGLLLGLGVAMAVWPAVLVVAIAALSLRGPAMRAAGRTLGAAFVTWVGINFCAFVLSAGRSAEFIGSYLTADAQDGSIWKLLQTAGVAFSVRDLNLVVLCSWVLALVAVFAYGALRARPPGLAALAFALLAVVLAVGKVYEPAYALWLLPLAVLATRRLRDVMLWQGAELFFCFATWWHLGGYTDDLAGGDVVYTVAVILRVVAELWFAARVLAVPRRESAPPQPLPSLPPPAGRLPVSPTAPP